MDDACSTPSRGRSRAAVHFALVVVAMLLSFGCAAPPTARHDSPGPGVRGYDDTRLQLLVHWGMESLAVSPCRAALLLGVLDDDASGEKLLRLQERAAMSRAGGACAELIAAARIVRSGRIGELDLAAEMAHPSPIVRAVALRYAVGGLPPAQAREVVVAAMSDDVLDVRIVAYRAAAALGDPSLAGVLAKVTATDETEDFWRCTSLAKLEPSTTCAEPAGVRQVLPPGDVLPVDKCEAAKADMAKGERQDALWFFLANAFLVRVEPLDRIEPAQRAQPPCLLDEASEDELLGSGNASAEDQALVAAALLWRRHEPVGVVRERRVQLGESRGDLMDYCSSSQDCPSDTDCFRAPGRGRSGVCGSGAQRAEDRRPTVYVTVGSNACWSFLDCPAFYSCYYPDPYSAYGVCVY